MNRSHHPIVETSAVQAQFLLAPNPPETTLAHTSSVSDDNKNVSKRTFPQKVPHTLCKSWEKLNFTTEEAEPNDLNRNGE